MKEGRIGVVDSSTMRVVFLILLVCLGNSEGGNIESGLADGTLHSPIARAAPLFWLTVGWRGRASRQRSLARDDDARWL